MYTQVTHPPEVPLISLVAFGKCVVSQLGLKSKEVQTKCEQCRDRLGSEGPFMLQFTLVLKLECPSYMAATLHDAKQKPCCLCRVNIVSVQSLASFFP